jgi:hypothetical protein
MTSTGSGATTATATATATVEAETDTVATERAAADALASLAATAEQAEQMTARFRVEQTEAEAARARAEEEAQAPRATVEFWINCAYEAMGKVQSQLDSAGVVGWIMSTSGTYLLCGTGYVAAVCMAWKLVCWVYWLLSTVLQALLKVMKLVFNLIKRCCSGCKQWQSRRNGTEEEDEELKGGIEGLDAYVRARDCVLRGRGVDVAMKILWDAVPREAMIHSTEIRKELGMMASAVPTSVRGAGHWSLALGEETLAPSTTMLLESSNN